MTPQERANAALANDNLDGIDAIERETIKSEMLLAICAAVSAEREACAAIAEDFRRHRFDEEGTEPESIARLIRARGAK